MSTCIHVAIVLLFAALVFLHIWIKDWIASKTLRRWCDAGDRLKEWRSANSIGAGESSYAQGLVLETIAAYEAFLKTHPYAVRDEKYLDFLRSLLTERSPDPDPAPKTKGIPRIALLPAELFFRFLSPKVSPVFGKSLHRIVSCTVHICTDYGNGRGHDLEAALDGELPGRGELDGVVGAAGAHVGELLALDGFDSHVVADYKEGLGLKHCQPKAIPFSNRFGTLLLPEQQVPT
jgi:hypothetical protein